MNQGVLGVEIPWDEVDDFPEHLRRSFTEIEYDTIRNENGFLRQREGFLEFNVSFLYGQQGGWCGTQFGITKTLV